MPFLSIFAKWSSDIIVNWTGSWDSCINSVSFHPQAIINQNYPFVKRTVEKSRERVKPLLIISICYESFYLKIHHSADVGKFSDIYVDRFQLNTWELCDEEKSLGLLVHLLYSHVFSFVQPQFSVILFCHFITDFCSVYFNVLCMVQCCLWGAQIMQGTCL